MATNLQLFSTCPQSKDFNQDVYFKQVIDVAQWSEAAGCVGILVYTDNGLADPWLIAQVILQNTRSIAPLVAVQPIYMHPYTAAKMVSTLSYLYKRKIYLNMLAGGFKNDLIALGDDTPHDDRYLRTTEYTLILKALLRGENVSFEGKYYQVKNLKLTPALDPELFPGILISGSSDAGLEASRAIGATAIKYPKPPGEEEVQNESLAPGVRVGIIARDSSAAAWEVGYERFPEDRKGQIAHAVAMKVSDSLWHKQLSAMGDQPVTEQNPYWLGPFKNYRTFCPYLVGDYGQVAHELKRYLDLGFETFILDIPPSQEELTHIRKVFDEVSQVGA
ncbi:MAG: LLM class flavin-dependent oxidoreductase [Trueperaceae bacterium]|nr:LLM class flavin-dependent oxidoreductase [Trueperaceae bacterium]